MADLLQVREKFLANPNTVKNIRRDFPEWRKGRLHYAFWALDVDVPSVRAQVLAAERHLEPFLLAGYCRQPHITLGICGFLSDKTQHADDYAVSSFQSHVAALQSLQLQPFRIEVGTLASFGSAPFLYVKEQSNQLCQLHQSLHSLEADPDFRYVPHVTVGLYAEAWPIASVSKVLDAFSQHHVTDHLVSRVSLMCYAADEIGRRLMKSADYDLVLREMQWLAHAPTDVACLSDFSYLRA